MYIQEKCRTHNDNINYFYGINIGKISNNYNKTTNNKTNQIIFIILNNGNIFAVIAWPFKNKIFMNSIVLIIFNISSINDFKLLTWPL